MYCSVLSATVSGMEMIPVQVEADVSDGMPQFTMVGYVSAQVKEAQDRVRTALKNIGFRPGHSGKRWCSVNSALTAMCRRSAVYFRQRRRRGSLDAQRFLFQPEMPRKGVWSAGFTSLESRIYRSF